MVAERSAGQNRKWPTLSTLVHVNDSFLVGLSAQQSQPSRQSPQKGAKVQDEDEQASEDAGFIQAEEAEVEDEPGMEQDD